MLILQYVQNIYRIIASFHPTHCKCVTKRNQKYDKIGSWKDMSYTYENKYEVSKYKYELHQILYIRLYIIAFIVSIYCICEV